MRIFFLDDMEIRRERFAEKFASADVIFAETAAEAISILSKDLDFDEIYLDHDLGGRVYVDSEDENTGYQVAKFLQNKKVRGKIIVHSWNTVGANNMLSILPRAIHTPFQF